LAEYGIDQQTINAESFSQAREYFLMFQTLLDVAQSRRISLLREIKLHRATADSPLGVKARTNVKLNCWTLKDF
jgi:hypothetical protein